jgi:hypothetical protein
MYFFHSEHISRGWRNIPFDSIVQLHGTPLRRRHDDGAPGQPIAAWLDATAACRIVIQGLAQDLH